MQRGDSAGLTYQPQLDGIRALGVLCIIAFHARGHVFPGGYIGVDVFFVLSGFLITVLLLQEHAALGTVSLKRFYVRRALRLLPALLVVCASVMTVASFVPRLEERTETMRGSLAALTYTAAPAAAFGWADLGLMLHTWSLSVEEYFYLFWPLLLLALLRRHRPVLERALILLLIAAIAYRWWAADSAGWSITRIAYGPDSRLGQLLVGCALAVFLAKVTPRLRAWHGAAALALLVAFVLLPFGQVNDFYYHGGSTAVALGSAVLIAACMAGPSSALSRLLSTRPMVWIGRRSYGIYLWNPPLVGITAATPVPGRLQLPVKLALTFLVPALSYRWIERPFLRLGRRLSP
jgi:peptidoglycan/LPS O-acetylase OafA/YrhL